MKVGIIFGAFDLLHVGHLHLIKQCRLKCDYLIVGLHVDPSIEREAKNKPIESVTERFIRLKSNKHIDQVIPYETEDDLFLILEYIKPDVRFLGSDYNEGSDYKPVTAPDAVKIEFINSLPIHTSDLRERIKKS